MSFSPTSTSNNPMNSGNNCIGERWLLRRLKSEVTKDIPTLVQLNPALKSTLLIGRDSSGVDIYLDSSKQLNLISRKHAKLVYNEANNAWEIIDLNSMNGLCVN